MKETMKEVVITGPKQYEVREVPVPHPGDGEVLIQMKAAGVCGSDVHQFLGENPNAVFPRVPGHENAGVIVAVGKDVKNIKVGDHVVVDLVVACGECPQCKKGRRNVCRTVKARGSAIDGGWREYFAVPEHEVYLLPQDMPFKDAALIEPFAIGGHCTTRAGIQGGESVLVLGSGTIGAVILQTLKLKGCRVICADINDASLARAKEYGVSFCTVNHASHYGFGGFYAMQAAEEGMIGFNICNSPALVAPFGGASAMLGTNPLAVSLPTGDPDRPLTLDMATSAAARGKVTLAKKNGQSIPLGWGVDSQGNPTTDPEAVLSGGAMLPMGGPKGYAISLIIDVLCSCITGSADGQTMGSFYDFTRTQNSGYCFAALDLSRMVEPEVWSQRVQALLDTMRACPRQPGVEAIQIPGQPEQEKQERNLREGIALSSAVEGELRALSERLQVPLPAPLGE